MSRDRQVTRAERAAAAQTRAAALAAERQKAAQQRARRGRRSLRWKRLRLWQSGQRRSDTRERLGALGALDLLVLVGVFVWTRSGPAVLGTALILLIGTPVLVLVVFDRRRR